jgi:hypothetical protein
MPVAIRVSLQFKETEIRTKASYDREDGLNRTKTDSRTQDEIAYAQSLGKDAFY